MKISKEGLDKLIEYEGCEFLAYRDVAGHLTIGVGHLITKYESSSGNIKIGNEFKKWRYGLTHSECMTLLDQDCDPCENAVNTLVTRCLTQPQFDSLVSFTFNLGTPSLEHSTLLKVLNADGSPEEIVKQFRKWVWAGGKVIAGLKDRREKELKAFLG